VDELRLDSERIAAVLAGLLQEGFVSDQVVRKSVSWHLTESGAAYLATLPAWPPPKVVKPVHDDAQLLAQQQAYALFQLFIAKGGKFSAAQLRTKLMGAKAKLVRFDAATVEWVMSLLVADGSVIEQRRGKSVSWQPVESAASRLAKLEQHPEVELTLNGAAWNAVKLTNAGASSVSQSPPQPSPGVPGKGVRLASPALSASDRGSTSNALPSAAEFEDIILAEFRELLREKHWHTGMVPIHEIRQRVAAGQGERAARHDVLDERVRQLRRADRLRLISLSDLSRATPEQLADSIPGDNETFFYVGEP